jgi:hypothetical protein
VRVFTQVSPANRLEKREPAMSVEARIDDLIEAGRGVLDSDFDPVAFQCWRQRAFDCLTALVGPDHVYTKHFANFVRQGGKTDLLAAAGILSAAQEQMVGKHKELETVKANGDVTSGPLPEKMGGSTNRRAI